MNQVGRQEHPTMFRWSDPDIHQFLKEETMNNALANAITYGRDGIVYGRDGIVYGRDGIVYGRDGIVYGCDGIVYAVTD